MCRNQTKTREDYRETRQLRAKRHRLFTRGECRPLTEATRTNVNTDEETNVADTRLQLLIIWGPK